MNYVDSFTASLVMASEYITAGLVITAGLAIGFMFLWAKLNK